MVQIKSQTLNKSFHFNLLSKAICNDVKYYQLKRWGILSGAEGVCWIMLQLRSARQNGSAFGPWKNKYLLKTSVVGTKGHNSKLFDKALKFNNVIAFG